MSSATVSKKTWILRIQHLCQLILINSLLAVTTSSCVFGISTDSRAPTVSDYGAVYLSSAAELKTLKFSAFYPVDEFTVYRGNSVKLVCYDSNENEVVLDEKPIGASETLVSHTLEGTADLAETTCVRTGNGALITLYFKLGSAFKPVMSNKNMACISQHLSNGQSVKAATVACLAEDPREIGHISGTNSSPMHINELTVWVNDNTKPTITFETKPPASTSANTLTFEVDVADNGGYGVIDRIECRFGNDPFAECPAKLTYANIFPGRHTIEYRAFDGAGNVSDILSHTYVASCPAGSKSQNGVCEGIKPKLTFRSSLNTTSLGSQAGSRKLNLNQAVYFTWSTQYASRCFKSGAWSGNAGGLQGAPGAAQISWGVGGKRQFRITCENQHGSVSKTITINWAAKISDLNEIHQRTIAAAQASPYGPEAYYKSEQRKMTTYVEGLVQKSAQVYYYEFLNIVVEVPFSDTIEQRNYLSVLNDLLGSEIVVNRTISLDFKKYLPSSLTKNQLEYIHLRSDPRLSIIDKKMHPQRRRFSDAQKANLQVHVDNISRRYDEHFARLAYRIALQKTFLEEKNYRKVPMPNKAKNISRADWDQFTYTLQFIDNANNKIGPMIEDEIYIGGCTTDLREGQTISLFNPQPLPNSCDRIRRLVRETVNSEINALMQTYNVPPTEKRNGGVHALVTSDTYVGKVSFDVITGKIGRYEDEVVAEASFARQYVPMIIAVAASVVTAGAANAAYAAALEAYGSAALANAAYVGVVAVGGGAIAEVSGGSFQDGFLSGLMTGVISRGFQALDLVASEDFSGADLLDSTEAWDDLGKVLAQSSVTGCAVSEVTGGDCKNGAQSALYGSFVSLASQMIADPLSRHLIDPKKMDFLTRTSINAMIDLSVGTSFNYIINGGELDRAFQSAVQTAFANFYNDVVEANEAATRQETIDEAWRDFDNELTSGDSTLLELAEEVGAVATAVGLDEAYVAEVEDYFASVPEPNFDHINSFGEAWIADQTAIAIGDAEYQLSLEDRFTVLIQGATIDPNLPFNPIEMSLPDGCNNISCSDPNDLRTAVIPEVVEAIAETPQQISPTVFFQALLEASNVVETIEDFFDPANLDLAKVSAAGELCALAWRKDPRASAACEMLTLFERGAAVNDSCYYDPSVLGCGGAVSLLLANTALAVLPGLKPMPNGELNDLKLKAGAKWIEMGLDEIFSDE